VEFCRAELLFLSYAQRWPGGR